MTHRRLAASHRSQQECGLFYRVVSSSNPMAGTVFGPGSASKYDIAPFEALAMLRLQPLNLLDRRTWLESVGAKSRKTLKFFVEKDPQPVGHSSGRRRRACAPASGRPLSNGGHRLQTARRKQGLGRLPRSRKTRGFKLRVRLRCNVSAHVHSVILLLLFVFAMPLLCRAIHFGGSEHFKVLVESMVEREALYSGLSHRDLDVLEVSLEFYIYIKL